MPETPSKKVVIIVAHPDDESLWAGGTILDHPEWQCYIVCLCRKNDTDRSTRFYKTLKTLNAQGIMGDLDDGPEQYPLDQELLWHSIIELLPPGTFDLIISHNPNGEYTKHLRHEEIGKAVIDLWLDNKLSASELWTFAYEDHKMEYYPQAIKNATLYQIFSPEIWQEKYRLITENYGFDATSWEAQTTPKAEAFWQFTDPCEAKKWLSNSQVK
jgi:LmbE family N-acetylglucosaminyl deacetylase